MKESFTVPASPWIDELAQTLAQAPQNKRDGVIEELGPTFGMPLSDQTFQVIDRGKLTPEQVLQEGRKDYLKAEEYRSAQKWEEAEAQYRLALLKFFISEKAEGKQVADANKGLGISILNGPKLAGKWDECIRRLEAAFSYYNKHPKGEGASIAETASILANLYLAESSRLIPDSSKQGVEMLQKVMEHTKDIKDAKKLEEYANLFWALSNYKSLSKEDKDWIIKSQKQLQELAKKLTESK